MNNNYHSIPNLRIHYEHHGITGVFVACNKFTVCWVFPFKMDLYELTVKVCTISDAPVYPVNSWKGEECQWFKYTERKNTNFSIIIFILSACMWYIVIDWCIHKSSFTHFQHSFPEDEVQVTGCAGSRWKLGNREAESTITQKYKLQNLCCQLRSLITCPWK